MPYAQHSLRKPLNWLMLTLACAKMLKALEAWSSLKPQGSNPSYQQDVLWRCEASRMIDSSVLAGCG
ncbi:Choline transport protein [Fusarium oxysporum f. sp. albedinis]|nr:Choline transport protein [Fusarium oxysporum f. sp. albedinis]